MARKFDIENVRLTDNLDEVMEATEEAIEKALIQVGIEAQTNVSNLAAVVTGRLAASITYATQTMHGEPDRDRLEESEVLKDTDYRMHGTPERHTVVVGTNVEYAKAREYGPGRSPHYIQRGLQDNTNKYKEIFSEELKSIE